MTEARQCLAHCPGERPVPVGTGSWSRRACPSALSENKPEGQQSSLKYRIWAFIICTASGQRNMRLKGSNTHIYIIFLGQVALYSGSKRYDIKGLGPPVHSGWDSWLPSLARPTICCDLGQVSLLPQAPKATKPLLSEISSESRQEVSGGKEEEEVLSDKCQCYHRLWESLRLKNGT